MQDMMQDQGLSPEQDDPLSPNRAAITLAQAIDQARAEQVGGASAAVQTQGIAIRRLQALRLKLAPLYAAIPRDVELFDLGLIAHEKPRLFIDIIAFIEMTRDQTAYCLVQEKRSGRIILAQTPDDTAIIHEVTRYVARRLVERERALAADAGVARPMPPVKKLAEPEKLPLPAAFDPKAIERAVAALETATVVASASPKAPLTAAEAFKQWSSASASVAEAVEGRTTVQEIAVQEPVVRETVPSDAGSAQGAAYDRRMGSIAGVSNPLAQETLVSATLKPQLREQAQVEPSDQNPAQFTPRQSVATAPARPKANPSRTLPRNSGVSWLWPVLAMLIGIGAGAAALIYSVTNTG